MVVLRPILVERDVDGCEDVHCVTESVLNLLRAVAILAGDYLYSQRMLFSSMLRWVVLVSARLLHRGRRTSGRLRSLCCGTVRQRWRGGCALWSLITPASI